MEAIDLWEGEDIEAFNITLEVLDGDDEVLDTVRITDGFTYPGGTGTNTITFTATNELVGARKYLITLWDSRTTDTTIAVGGDLTITGANDDFTIETRLNIDTTAELIYDVDSTPNIGVAISVTSEDFTEGGVEHDVTNISFNDFAFTVAKASDGTDEVVCSIGSLAFDDTHAGDETIGNTRNFNLEIPLTRLDSLADSKCARLDYNIVATSFDVSAGVEITLTESRAKYTSTTVTQEPLVEGRTYTRIGARGIPPSVAPATDTASVATGDTVTIDVTVTDNDNDDGPDTGNADTRYEARVSSTTCDTSKWSTTALTPKSGESYVYTINVTALAAAADNDVCVVSIIVAEDRADSDPSTTTVTVTNVAPPTITTPTLTITDDASIVAGVQNANLGTFTITRNSNIVPVTFRA